MTQNRKKTCFTTNSCIHLQYSSRQIPTTNKKHQTITNSFTFSKYMSISQGINNFSTFQQGRFGLETRCIHTKHNIFFSVDSHYRYRQIVYLKKIRIKKKCKSRKKCTKIYTGYPIAIRILSSVYFERDILQILYTSCSI